MKPHINANIGSHVTYNIYSSIRRRITKRQIPYFKKACKIIKILSNVFMRNLLQNECHPKKQICEGKRKLGYKSAYLVGVNRAQSSEKSEEYFILKPEFYSSRYYAGLLWNWRIFNKLRTHKVLAKFVKKVVYLTIKSMNRYEFEVFLNVLKTTSILDTEQSDIDCTKTAILPFIEGLENLDILRSIIYKWFDIMPLLMELKKYVCWKYLMERRSYLLDSDDLYDIYLALKE